VADPELEDFFLAFRQEVGLHANIEGEYQETSFVEVFAHYLIDAGEFDAFDAAHYQSRGRKVSGSAGDPLHLNGVLSLVVADWDSGQEVVTIGKQDVETAFKRLKSFLTMSLGADWSRLDETSEGYGLADLIHSRRKDLTTVRLYLVSNRKLSSRIGELPDEVVEGIPVQYRIWDLERLRRLAESGREKEQMEIDLVEEFGSALPCLPANVGQADYQAYLAVVPGPLLASLYERWGVRLLEQNVRCYLQARGKVNKGIRDTIVNEPGMFFAYNNGITATAEHIELAGGGDGLAIRRLKNLQIVNGGQTTASIFSAGRGKAKVDLDRVFVQMKLSVVEPELAEKIVPNISRFANSQNAVRAADFFSNHPYHVRLEGFSRRLFAPALGSALHQTRWFYERARGQYQDARSQFSTGKPRRKFDQECPRAQVFTKTDLAKFEGVWEKTPHIVSQGAQKNFAHFVITISDAWKKNDARFNELYFRRVVAKAIIFKATERMVSSQDWYEGGYRANIVAYAISRLAHELDTKKYVIDFDAIWKTQGPSPALMEAITGIARAMQAVLVSPPEGIRNISEYAKKEFCWKLAMAKEVSLPRNLLLECLDATESSSVERAASRDQRELSGIEAQTHVVGQGRDYWESVYRWAQANRKITPKDRSLLLVAVSKVPTVAQSNYILRLLRRLEGEGLPRQPSQGKTSAGT
jgi:hypothetical protein